MDETKTFFICGCVVDKTATSNRVGLELESIFGLRKRMVITTTKDKKQSEFTPEFGPSSPIRLYSSHSQHFPK